MIDHREEMSELLLVDHTGYRKTQHASLFWVDVPELTKVSDVLTKTAKTTNPFFYLSFCSIYFFVLSSCSIHSSIFQPPNSGRMSSSWGSQLRLLLKRNYLMKVRTMKETLMEIFFPIIFFMLLVMLKVSLPPSSAVAPPFVPFLVCCCFRSRYLFVAKKKK